MESKISASNTFAIENTELFTNLIMQSQHNTHVECQGQSTNLQTDVVEDILQIFDTSPTSETPVIDTSYLTTFSIEDEWPI